MFLSQRLWRRWRRRGVLLALGLVSGGACWGGLAWAHSRPSQPISLPAGDDWQICTQSKFSHWKISPPLPLSSPSDPLAEPELHQMEEACNLNGLYPTGGGADFSLQKLDWTYSSLDGLQRPSDSPANSPADWDSQVPVWLRAGRNTLNQCLPHGIEFSKQVAGCEGRIYPLQQRAQIAISLHKPLPIRKNKLTLAQAWDNLPAGNQVACLDKRLAQTLFTPVGARSLTEKLWGTADNWVGLTVQEELSPTNWRYSWRKVQNNRLPLAIWTDATIQSNPGSSGIEVAPQTSGTTFGLGTPIHKITGTTPWCHWKEVENWTGAGRNRFTHEGTTWRLEWAIHQESAHQIQLEIAWTADPPEEQPEIASAGPDLEKIYDTKSNVQAGE